MSALEPDAPAPHIWPKWRAAVRQWWLRRSGDPRRSRGVSAEPRGKGPALGDLVRVGQVMVELGLLHRGELTRHGRAIVEVAMGQRPRRNDAVGAEGVATLVKKLERRLRSAGVVAKPRPRWVTKRAPWIDPNDGQEHETRIVVERA